MKMTGDNPSADEVARMRRKPLAQWCEEVGMTYTSGRNAFHKGELFYPLGHPLAGRPVTAAQMGKGTNIVVLEPPDAELLAMLIRSADADTLDVVIETLQGMGYRVEKPDFNQALCAA